MNPNDHVRCADCMRSMPRRDVLGHWYQCHAVGDFPAYEARGSVTINCTDPERAA